MSSVRFNITNIIPQSPDDGSLELKSYSVDFVSQKKKKKLSFYFDYFVINFSLQSMIYMFRRFVTIYGWATNFQIYGD